MTRALKLSDNKWHICYVTADDLSIGGFNYHWVINYVGAKYHVRIIGEINSYRKDGNCKIITGLRRCLPWDDLAIVTKWVDGILVDIAYDDAVMRAVDPKSDELLTWVQSFDV